MYTSPCSPMSDWYCRDDHGDPSILTHLLSTNLVDPKSHSLQEAIEEWLKALIWDACSLLVATRIGQVLPSCMREMQSPRIMENAIHPMAAYPKAVKKCKPHVDFATPRIWTSRVSAAKQLLRFFGLSFMIFMWQIVTVMTMKPWPGTLSQAEIGCLMRPSEPTPWTEKNCFGIWNELSLQQTCAF